MLLPETTMKSMRSPSDFKVLLGMVAVLIVPIALTLMTIREPRSKVVDLAANPSPLGYTWSLSLFIVPVLVLALWQSSRKENPIQKKAFWITAVLIAGAGVFLDICFGLTFFTFENRGAVLGKYFWGISPTHGLSKEIPIEELGFYFFGIVAVLLVYVWGDEHWFGAYNADDFPRRNTRRRQVISFHPGSAIFGVAIFLVGWLFKKYAPGHDHEGFPGYFLFLTAVGTIPSILFFPVANPYINWRAFSLAFMFILLVSLFWEAAIAVPYQWWGYQPQQMLGLSLNGFSGLPVEASLLWMGVTWATIIVYETIYTILYMKAFPKPAPHTEQPFNGLIRS
jgi:hypothetical protein